MAERRDVRRFRADPVPDDVLDRVLAAAHGAPSVGLMQPWRFIIVREIATRSEMRRLSQRERLRQSERFDARARHFLDQKIEGVVEAPLGVVVCCDPGPPGLEVLGRSTIPQTDVYSTACAIENLWLAARAEGLGVGWVSFYRPDDMRELLGIPPRVEPLAWLCIGWPDERPVRPGLEAAGWATRMPISEVVMEERWTGATVERPAAPAPPGPDRPALVAARDRADRLVVPGGSLGALGTLVERWAGVSGEAPPQDLRAGVLVLAGDHGHVGRGTSLYDATVTAQIVAATARGETAVAALARAGGHTVYLADVGLRGPRLDDVRDHRVADGTADLVVGDALTAVQVEEAWAAGGALAQIAIDDGVDAVVVGEIGIGNTTTAAALAATLGVGGADAVVGRGTGADHAGIVRKREVVEAVLARVGPATPLTARAALRVAGGLEIAAIAGAVAVAAASRVPVILDGYAASVGALCAVRDSPLCGEVLFAGHRSAEPAHGLVLAELGLEPLVDLRLRIGEGSGALVALPLIVQAGRLHRDVGVFADG